MTAKMIKLLLCARTRTRERGDYRTFHYWFFQLLQCCAFHRQYNKQAVVLYKTSRCFVQNEPSFCVKRVVVFGKTSRCFVQNEPLFCVKRAVVLCKMSRRFTQVLRNDSLHLVDIWEGQCPRGIGIRKEG